MKQNTRHFVVVTAMIWFVGPLLCSGWLNTQTRFLASLPSRSHSFRPQNYHVGTTRGVGPLSANTDHNNNMKNERAEPEFQPKKQHEKRPKQNLEQRLQDLLDAENSQNEESTQQSAPAMRIPDLTAFQRQVDRNAAGPTMRSPFAELSVNSDDNNDVDQNTPENDINKSSMRYDSAQSSMSTSSINLNYAGPTPSSLSSSSMDAEYDDGFYLAPDLYERSRELLNADGSLNFGAVTKGDDRNEFLRNAAVPDNVLYNGPDDDMKAVVESLLLSTLEANDNAPLMNTDSSGRQGNYNEPSNVDYENWNDIWAAIQEQKTKPYNENTAEELHQEVFANEQGYLNQSEVFRKGLTDPELAAQATAKRRSANFRARQTKAMEELNRQLEEFEEEFEPLLLTREQEQTLKRCCRCGCKLVSDDYDIKPQLWMLRQNLTTLCGTCYNILVNTPYDSLEKRVASSQSSLSSEEETSPETSQTLTSSISNYPGMREEAPAGDSLQFGANQTVSRPSPSNSEESEISNSIEEATSSSWTEVVDPDSGETFYWNEETDEVRWDI